MAKYIENKKKVVEYNKTILNVLKSSKRGGKISFLIALIFRFDLLKRKEKPRRRFISVKNASIFTVFHAENLLFLLRFIVASVFHFEI